MRKRKTAVVLTTEEKKKEPLEDIVRWLKHPDEGYGGAPILRQVLLRKLEAEAERATKLLKRLRR